MTFCRVGFHSATIDDIAAEAAVTKGAIYFHFTSKEHVARAVIDTQHQIASSAAMDILQRTDSAFESMLLLSADLATRLMTDPIVMAGIRLTTDSSNFNPPLLGPYEDWLLTFETLARTAISQGEVRDSVDPHTLANFVIPAFTGVQLVSDVFTRRQNLLQRINEMWSLLIDAIVPQAHRESAHQTLSRAISFG